MKTLFLFFCFFFQADSLEVVQESDAIIPQKIHPMIELGGVPVNADSTLFMFNGIGPYSLQERVNRLQSRLDELKDIQLEITPLKVNYGEQFNDIEINGLLLLSISESDAQSIGLSRRGATDYYFELLEKEFSSEEPVFSNLLFVNIAIAVLIITAFIFGLKYYNRLFRLFRLKFQGQKGKLFKGVTVKQYELLSEEKQVVFAGYVLTFFKYALLLFIIYLLLPTLFALFPWTRGIANQLIGYIVDPLLSLGKYFIDFIPNLLFIAVIVVVVRYVLKVLKFFRNEVASGRLIIHGFYPEWSKPTFNIIKGVVIALGFIGIWPLLPMSDSDIFKGVSTFFGLLVALGGAGAFSNIISGLVITYMRSFKIGDRVKIGDVVGDVKEKALLNTKIKTIKNEIITVPNSQMISSHTINYTTANDEDGLILHTTVTIGYDVPWRDVHKLLIEAALETEFVKKKPHPFVLQTSLDDFYVSYQLNARTREIHKMPVIYSDLHKNIQDTFNEAGVEIMSPHYGAHRDGNQITIPQKHLPEDYQAPWFRFKKEE